jgi:hypothetical protein
VSEHIDLERVLFLLHGDQELFQRLCEVGLLPTGASVFTSAHAETARVVGTLVHELDVNWSGVEVVLHLRSELIATRRQVRELVTLLNERKDLRRRGPLHGKR